VVGNGIGTGGNLAFLRVAIVLHDNANKNQYREHICLSIFTYLYDDD